jgi:hypothetical protein
MTNHPSDDTLVALKSIFPDEIDWQPFPACPPQARLTVLAGHPAEPGMYVIRVKLPGGVKLMPHRHPENRIHPVISGIFYVGVGERSKADALTAYPPGSVVLSRKHTPLSLGQVRRIRNSSYRLRPLRIEYLDLGDDPRNSALKYSSAVRAVKSACIYARRRTVCNWYRIPWSFRYQRPIVLVVRASERDRSRF